MLADEFDGVRRGYDLAGADDETITVRAIDDGQSGLLLCVPPNSMEDQWRGFGVTSIAGHGLLSCGVQIDPPAGAWVGKPTWGR